MEIVWKSQSEQQNNNKRLKQNRTSGPISKCLAYKSSESQNEKKSAVYIYIFVRTQNPPNLIKDKFTYLTTSVNPNKICRKNTTPRNITVKLLKQNYRKKVRTQQQNITHFIWRNNDSNSCKFIIRNCGGQIWYKNIF